MPPPVQVHFKEEPEETIVLENFTFDALKSIIDLIYFGCVEISDHQEPLFLNILELLQITCVKLSTDEHRLDIFDDTQSLNYKKGKKRKKAQSLKVQCDKCKENKRDVKRPKVILRIKFQREGVGNPDKQTEETHSKVVENDISSDISCQPFSVTYVGSNLEPEDIISVKVGNPDKQIEGTHSKVVENDISSDISCQPFSATYVGSNLEPEDIISVKVGNPDKQTEETNSKVVENDISSDISCQPFSATYVGSNLEPEDIISVKAEKLLPNIISHWNMKSLYQEEPYGHNASKDITKPNNLPLKYHQFSVQGHTSGTIDNSTVTAVKSTELRDLAPDNVIVNSVKDFIEPFTLPLNVPTVPIELSQQIFQGNNLISFTTPTLKEDESFISNENVRQGKEIIDVNRELESNDLHANVTGSNIFGGNFVKSDFSSQGIDTFSDKEKRDPQVTDLKTDPVKIFAECNFVVENSEKLHESKTLMSKKSLKHEAIVDTNSAFQFENSCEKHSDCNIVPTPSLESEHEEFMSKRSCITENVLNGSKTEPNDSSENDSKYNSTNESFSLINKTSQGSEIFPNQTSDEVRGDLGIGSELKYLREKEIKYSTAIGINTPPPSQDLECEMLTIELNSNHETKIVLNTEHRHECSNKIISESNNVIETWTIDLPFASRNTDAHTIKENFISNSKVNDLNTEPKILDLNRTKSVRENVINQRTDAKSYLNNGHEVQECSENNYTTKYSTSKTPLQDSQVSTSAVQPINCTEIVDSNTSQILESVLNAPETGDIECSSVTSLKISETVNESFLGFGDVMSDEESCDGSEHSFQDNVDWKMQSLVLSILLHSVTTDVLQEDDDKLFHFETAAPAATDSTALSTVDTNANDSSRAKHEMTRKSSTSNAVIERKCITSQQNFSFESPLVINWHGRSLRSEKLAGLRSKTLANSNKNTSLQSHSFKQSENTCSCRPCRAKFYRSKAARSDSPRRSLRSGNFTEHNSKTLANSNKTTLHQSHSVKPSENTCLCRPYFNKFRKASPLKKQFPCNESKVLLPTRSRLKVHEKTDTKNELFKCKICSATFKLKLKLKHHMKLHDSKKKKLVTSAQDRGKAAKNKSRSK